MLKSSILLKRLLRHEDFGRDEVSGLRRSVLFSAIMLSEAVSFADESREQKAKAGLFADITYTS
jgi:hypothetical protein